MQNAQTTMLEVIVGSLVKVETKDGILMKGKLTGLKSYSFKANGIEQIIWSHLVLDDDQEKVIELTRVQIIEEL